MGYPLSISDLLAPRLLDAPLRSIDDRLPKDMCVVTVPGVGGSSMQAMTLPVRNQQDYFSLLDAWYGSPDAAANVAGKTLGFANGLSDTVHAHISEADALIGAAAKKLPKGKLTPADVEELLKAVSEAKEALGRTKGLRIPGMTARLDFSRAALDDALQQAGVSLEKFAAEGSPSSQRAARRTRNDVPIESERFLRASEKTGVLFKNASDLMNNAGRVLAALPLGAGMFDLIAARNPEETERIFRRLAKPATDVAVGELVAFASPRIATAIAPRVAGALLLTLAPAAPGVFTVVAVSAAVTLLGLVLASEAGDWVQKRVELTPPD